jgi:urease accessory protein
MSAIARLLRYAAVAGLLLLAIPGAARAHAGAEGTGLLHGLLHPLGGLDHLLAMAGVGLLGAFAVGWRRLLGPATFLVAMAFAGALAPPGAGFPFLEPLIAASVLVVGALAALGRPLPAVATVMLIGVLGAGHGIAHGAEMPASAGMTGYGLGFLGTTALLHGAGLVLGAWLSRQAPSAPRIAGAALAGAGAALVGAAV